MKLLVISPHPDDAELGCAGLIIKVKQEGGQVRVLCLTSGEHGVPDISADAAGAIRELEAIKASEILGTEYEFWRLPDGHLIYENKLKDRIANYINEYEPDMVLVTHEQESHSDHRIAGKLVREAIKLCSVKEVLTYEVWTPQARTERVLDISGFIDKKKEAILAHHSQVNRTNFLEAALSLARYRGILQGRSEYAEVYNKLRQSGESRMRIGLALLTYAPSFDHPRADYARQTLESSLKLLDPGSGNELVVHIADDGSAPSHIEYLVSICEKYGYTPSITDAERGGYGKSYNLMCQALHSTCDLILPLEDDWELTKPLKLEYLVKALDQNPEIRSIRLGYLGITQPLRGTVVFRSGATYLLLDPDSPEPHVFCGHPRLETVEYQRDIGPWPEGLRAGETEWEVTHRWPARIGVAWPLDIGLPASQDWGALYAHIGSVSLNEVVPSGS